MKKKSLFSLALAALLATCLATNVWAAPPKYKMTTKFRPMY